MSIFQRYSTNCWNCRYAVVPKLLSQILSEVATHSPSLAARRHRQTNPALPHPARHPEPHATCGRTSTMQSPAFSAPLGIASCSFLLPRSSICSRRRITNKPVHCASVSMLSPANIAKKATKVDAVTSSLETGQTLFAAELSRLNVKQVGEFKSSSSIPPTTTTMTVKNTLMPRASADTKWIAAVRHRARPEVLRKS